MNARRIAWSIVGLLSLSAAAGDGFAAVPTYTIVELEPFPGDSHTEAYGINESGDVVGRSYHRTSPPPTLSYDGSAFLYRNGVMIDLGKLNGVITRAEAINENGAIVGWTEPGLPRAWIRTGDELVDLGTLGHCCAQAYDINDAGQVVGWSYGPDGQEHGFVWQNGAFEDLGPLPIGSWPFAINNVGQVVGVQSLWDQGKRITLSMLPQDINDLGQIVGYSGISAFIWEEGVYREIDTGTPTAINNDTEIVGNLTGSVGFLWRDGVTYALSPLISPPATRSFGLVTDINDRGQIVGLLTTGSGNGTVRGFLLVPIDPDLDQDGDVDLLDFFSIHGCLSGPQGIIIPGCQDGDLDDDGDVDLVDVRSLQLGFTGAQ